MQGILESKELVVGMIVEVRLRNGKHLKGEIYEITKVGFRFRCGGWIYWAQCPMIVAA